MANKKIVRSLVALLVVLAFSLTLLVTGISAAEADGADDIPGVDDAIEDPGETEAPDDADDKEDAADDADGADGADEADDKEDAEDKDEDEKKFGLGFWISMGVLAALAGVVIFFALKHRDKVGKWWRSIKSELKKIVWMPWGEVRKSTAVVLVVVIALGLVIALLDYTFWNSIISLRTLFG